MAMFRCNVTAVLRRPVRGADGAVSWAETTAPALLIESRSREADPAAAPAVREGLVFLFPPPAEPEPGDIVRCAGRDYELGAVRICRDLDGAVVCRRCEVVR